MKFKICSMPNAKRGQDAFYLPCNCNTDIKSHRIRTPKQIKMLLSYILRGSVKLSLLIPRKCLRSHFSSFKVVVVTFVSLSFT